MRFQCPFCQFINTVDSRRGGDLVNCQSCRKPLKVPTDIEEGSLIGDYVIKTKIGTGSIGTVFRANQISLGRTVALKVLSPAYTTRKGMEDFLSEARAAAKLNHPNLVQAFAVGESDGYCFMAMTLLSGMTVKNRMKQTQTIPVDEALHIVQQVAEALHYAWLEAKIIHRDVKPENIMLTDEGLVKLADLGLAMRPKDWKEGMEISGSPSYMSPEQFYGEKLDSRSDIYSLGVMLYQMLSGMLPFRAENVQELALQHTQEEAVPLSKLNLRIPPMVSALVKKMMAKQPEERFQSMEDLLGQVWKIRQKTAPDSDLVPSVHTISIRRLDYDRQLSAKRERSANEPMAQNLYPFGPGGPAVPVKIKNSSTVTLLLLVAVFVLVGLVIFLLMRTSELEKRGTISPEENNLRRRIELFCAMTEKNDSALDHLRQQSEELLREIAAVAAPKELENIVNLALQNAVFQRDYREAATYKSRYDLMKSTLDEKMEELNHARSEIQKVLTSSTTDQTVKKLTQAAAKLTHDNQELREKLSFYQIQTDSIHKTADEILNNAERWQVYFALRSTNPGSVYDILAISKSRYNRLSDSDYQFYSALTDVAFRMGSVLRKGTGIMGKTTQLNGSMLTLANVSGDKFTFLDDQKRIVSYQLSRLSAKELFLILKPIFPESDPEWVKYALCIVRGQVGDALYYVDGDPLRERLARGILTDTFERLTEAVKNDPARAVGYERSIRRMMGSGLLVKPYAETFEKLMAQAKAVVPGLPAFFLQSDSASFLQPVFSKDKIITP